LYEEADARALKAAQAKWAVERGAAAAFTFKPTLNPTSLALLAEREAREGGDIAPSGSGGGRHAPLHLRSEEVARASAEALHRLRLASQSTGEAAQCTFKPRINAHSAKIAASAVEGRGGSPGGGGGGGVAERLTRAGDEAAEKRAALRAALEREAAEKLTFAPRINGAATEELVRARLSKLDGRGVGAAAAALALSDPALHGEGGGDGGGGGGEEGGGGAAPAHERFLARQRALLEAGKAAAAARAAVLSAESGCTFTPDIGNAAEVLAVYRPERAGEAPTDAVQRLAVGEAERKRAAAAMKREAHYAQWRYAPAINPTSKRTGAAHTVEELNKNERGARVRLRAAAIAQAEFLAKHPFKPTLVAASGAPAPGGPAADSLSASPGALPQPPSIAPLLERVAEGAAAAAARRDAMRKQQEYEELRACTFAPETAASRASLAKLREAAAVDGGVVVVRGLGRHLELKEMTKQMEEEKRCGCYPAPRAPLARHTHTHTHTLFSRPATTPTPPFPQRARGGRVFRKDWRVGR
jgi:hypothetical protein